MRRVVFELLDKTFEEVLAYVRERNYTEAQMSDVMDTCTDLWWAYKDDIVYSEETIQNLKVLEGTLNNVYKVMDY